MKFKKNSLKPIQKSVDALWQDQYQRWLDGGYFMQKLLGKKKK